MQIVTKMFSGLKFSNDSICNKKIEGGGWLGVPWNFCPSFPYALFSHRYRSLLLVLKNGSYKQCVIISDASFLRVLFYHVFHSDFWSWSTVFLEWLFLRKEVVECDVFGTYCSCDLPILVLTITAILVCTKFCRAWVTWMEWKCSGGGEVRWWGRRWYTQI